MSPFVSLLLSALAAESQTSTLQVWDRFNASLTDVTACVVSESGCASLALKRENGYFRALVPEGAVLRVEAPGFEAATVKATPTTQVTLKATSQLRLSVRSFEKRPVTVSVSLTDGRFWTRFLVEAKLGLAPDKRDEAVLWKDVPPGRYGVLLTGPEMARVEKAVDVKRGESKDLGALSIERGLSLPGAVRDELGGPVGQALVSLVRPGRTEDQLPSGLKARTAADGSFTMVGVPLGEKLRFEASAPDHLGTEGFWGGESRLEIVLPRAQRIVGTVVDADKRPVDGATLTPVYRPTDESLVTGGQATTEADGRFSFTRRYRHKGSVRFKRPGLRERVVSFGAQPERPDGDLDLGEVVLSTGRLISGRVTDDAGNPLAGAIVVARNAKPVAGPTAGDPAIASAATSTEGAYELRGLPENDVVALTASRNGFAPRTIEAADVANDVDFILGRGGRIEGRLCGTAAELESSEVSFVGTPPKGSGSRGVDGSGRFVLDRLEPGTYTVSRSWFFRFAGGGMMHIGFGNGAQIVVVEEGGTASASIGCDGFLTTGSVRLDGQALSKAIGFAKTSEGFVDFLTDDGGRFSFRAPATGRASISFHRREVDNLHSCLIPQDGCLLELRSPIP